MSFDVVFVNAEKSTGLDMVFDSRSISCLWFILVLTPGRSKKAFVLGALAAGGEPGRVVSRLGPCFASHAAKLRVLNSISSHSMLRFCLHARANFWRIKVHEIFSTRKVKLGVLSFPLQCIIGTHQQACFKGRTHAFGGAGKRIVKVFPCPTFDIDGHVDCVQVYHFLETDGVDILHTVALTSLSACAERRGTCSPPFAPRYPVMPLGTKTIE